MGFAKGTDSKVREKMHLVSDADIVAYYLGVTTFPARIKSPLREDKHPSFGLYSRDGEHIYYVDWGRDERGSVIELLMRMWGTDYIDTWERIVKEVPSCRTAKVGSIKSNDKIDILRTHTQIQVKAREWKEYDFEYWKSYGITKAWLTFANVYPISYIIFTKENQEPVAVPADKYAYVFVEFKEGNTTYKVYQPYNTKGFKWFSSHDRSVISLWTKVPYYGQKICICSSLKDALCLWSNTGIPSISPQGEGYSISETAVSELKRRYKKIYILYDTDEAGRKDSKKLAETTGFKNILLPEFKGGKDVSDLYKIVGKEKFYKIIYPLFN